MRSLDVKGGWGVTRFVPSARAVIVWSVATVLAAYLALVVARERRLGLRPTDPAPARPAR